MNPNYHNQKEMVVDYIKKFGSITPAEAWDKLGITKLATVISNLRLKDKIKIKKQRISGTNRYGKKVSFERYSFPEENKNV